jgi:hypothetical protein
VNPDARREEPIGVALAAAFAPPLEALGFAPPVIADDSVRFNGAVVRFEAKYEPRHGELAVYVIPIGSDERIQLLMYLRAIRSPAAVDLGDAVADSAEVALRQPATTPRRFPTSPRCSLGIQRKSSGLAAFDGGKSAERR